MRVATDPGALMLTVVQRKVKNVVSAVRMRSVNSWQRLTACWQGMRVQPLRASLRRRDDTSRSA